MVKVESTVVNGTWYKVGWLVIRLVYTDSYHIYRSIGICGVHLSVVVCGGLSLNACDLLIVGSLAARSFCYVIM